MRRLLSIPFRHHELAQFTGQMNQSDSNYLRLPLQTHRRAQRIVDEIPRHLDHLLQFGLIALQALGVLDEESIWMLNLFTKKSVYIKIKIEKNISYLQIELNRLQQNPLQRHHFLLGILAERLELLVGQHRTRHPDDVATLFRCLLNFAGQKQTAAGRHVARKGFERMENVEAMEVHDSGGHCVVAKAHVGAAVHDESSAFFAVSLIRFEVEAISNRGGALQVFLVVVPVGHCEHCRHNHQAITIGPLREYWLLWGWDGRTRECAIECIRITFYGFQCIWK